MTDCPCRGCSGDPCLCWRGDHCAWNTANTYCSCCGETNYRWMGHLGAVARIAKRRGITATEYEAEREAAYLEEVE